MSDSTEASDEEADAAGGEEAGAGAATSRTKLRALQKARARANAVLAGVQEEAAEEPKVGTETEAATDGNWNVKTLTSAPNP